MPSRTQVEQFVGERIKPDPSSFDTSRMAIGEPGLPKRFTWRGQVIQILSVRRTWRETGPCRHGSGEQYVRKHWYEVEDAAGRVLKLCFERSPRRGSKGSWRLFSICDPPPAMQPPPGG